MATASGQELRERLAGHGHGTTTLASRPDGAHVSAEAPMFGDVPDAVRLRMELVARASASPETALPHVIALLVPEDGPRRQAIIEAITTNEPLREQWARTWEVLRR